MGFEKFSDADLEKISGGEVVQLEDGKWVIAGAFYADDFPDLEKFPKTKDGRRIALAYSKKYGSEEDAKKGQESLFEEMKIPGTR